MTAQLLGAYLTGALVGSLITGMVVLIVCQWLAEIRDAVTLPDPRQDDRTERIDPVDVPADLPRRWSL